MHVTVGTTVAFGSGLRVETTVAFASGLRVETNVAFGPGLRVETVVVFGPGIRVGTNCDLRVGPTGRDRLLTLGRGVDMTAYSIYIATESLTCRLL